MLTPMQVMSGFRQIRSTLKSKCNISKELSEIALWFTYENGALYVHDREEHKKIIALAIQNENTQKWKILLVPRTPGCVLIEQAMRENNASPHLWLNTVCQLRDFAPFRLLK